LRDVVKVMGRGNPFFTGELIQAMRRGNQLVLREDGQWGVSDSLLATLQRANIVVQTEGQWQLRPGADLTSVALDVPDSIQKLILSRLDRLPEAHKLTLKVSSVIGHHIDLALVAQVHPEAKDVEALEGQAEFMEVEEVIHGEAPRPRQYTFRHHTTQEVAYETLLYTQRQQLHRAVAEALAAQNPEASAQIAHHAFLGEAWPLALRYNLLAGEHAKQLYANQQSIDFLQKALRSAEALPETETAGARKRIHLALGELLVSTGQYDDAGRHLQAALELAQAQGDVEAEARAYRWLGRSHELRGEFVVALSWLEKGFAALNGRASTEGAEIALIAGLINIRQGKYDEALRYCERSLYIAQTLNDPAVRARTYNLMGIDDLRRGDSAACLERFSQALALYEQLQNVYGQATSHNLLANGHFMRDDWARADRHYRQSLDLFTQIGDAYNQVLVNNNLGGIALKQGRFEAALGYYQRAVRLLEQTGGSLWVLGALQMNTGHAYLRLKELDKANERLSTAQAYFDQVQQRDLLPELYGLMAEADWLRGNLDTAKSHGQRSLGLAREMEMPREAGHALRILGEIAAGAEGHAQQAHNYFAEGYRTLAEAGDEYESAKVRLAQARLYAAQGQKEQALQALGECAPVFVRLAVQPDLEDVNTLRQTLNGRSG
jgi:tetratricopeptide (TPR) repeat protein